MKRLSLSLATVALLSVSLTTQAGFLDNALKIAQAVQSGDTGAALNQAANMATAQKQQTKVSTRSNTGKAAVAPINTIKMADVNAGTKKINQWLKQNTGGVVDLDTLKNVAGSLPVIGNIISLTDAVYDVIEITKKPNPGFPDWLNLGIDLVGVIPLPSRDGRSSYSA